MEQATDRIDVRVLIVDDVENDALLVEAALQQGGYTVIALRVDTQASLEAALTGHHWDLIICDYSMPHYSGLRALALTRQHGLDLPFILMSGVIGEETAVGALKAGADDYIMKGNPARLVPSVERALREVAERRSRRQAEEALRVSNRELSRSNAELERFASIASHQFRAPLNTIGNYAQLLSLRYAGKFDEDADEFLSFITDAVKRLHGFLDAFLALAQVGAPAAGPASVDCAALMDKMTAYLRADILKSGAKVTHCGLPTVLGHRSQLGQVFLHLITNAITYRGEVSPQVAVTASRGTGEWLFCVKDNGIGIEPADTERIFAPFQRLHTPEAYSGTGMGLALCKKIIEWHGGRIWAEANPGQGMRFLFTLPVTPTSAALALP